MRLLHVGLVVGLVACGSAGAQDGQEGPLDPGPTQPPIPAEEPRDAPIPAEDGAIPGIPPEADAGLVWTEPPVSIPDASPMVDATPPPDSDAELPDAAAPPDATPSGCAGYQRIHVAIGTCVRAVNCTGYVLIGGDVSLGAGAAAYVPGTEPGVCVSNDQDACVRYNHPSASSPRAFDVFIRPNTPSTCVVTTYVYVGGTCPVNPC